MSTDISTFAKELLQLSETHQIVGICGSNFSGRSKLLKHITAHTLSKCFYIGTEIYESFSGLTRSVYDEVNLHGDAFSENESLSKLADAFALKLLYDRHPGMISGGEQAAVAVFCGLLTDPDLLLLDCTLEQLDTVKRLELFAFLNTSHAKRPKCFVADNRMEEWGQQIIQTAIPTQNFLTNPVLELRALLPTAIRELPRSHTGLRLDLSDLVVGYDKGPAILKQLTCSLTTGNIYCLTGQNGAGKSTLAKCLAGVIKPRCGEIHLNDVRQQSWKEPGRLCSYHFQHPDVALFERTVELELKVSIGKSSTKNYDLFGPTVKAFGLEHLLQQHPLSLPFPLRKRVALATAICRASPWIFLDEPTLGSDTENLLGLSQICQELAAIGRGVIVVSHSEAFNRSLGGYCLTLKEGMVQH